MAHGTVNEIDEMVKGLMAHTRVTGIVIHNNSGVVIRVESKDGMTNERAVRVAGHSMRLCAKGQQHVNKLMEDDAGTAGDDAAIQTIRMKTCGGDADKNEEIIVTPSKDYTMVVFQKVKEPKPVEEVGEEDD